MIGGFRFRAHNIQMCKVEMYNGMSISCSTVLPVGSIKTCIDTFFQGITIIFIKQGDKNLPSLQEYATNP